MEVERAAWDPSPGAQPRGLELVTPGVLGKGPCLGWGAEAQAG